MSALRSYRQTSRIPPVKGDSVVAGQRRHRPDYQIVMSMGLLMLLGLVVMYAIGPQRANVLNNAHGTDFYTATYFVVKQVASLAIALVAFAAAAFMPFAKLCKHGWNMVLFALVSSALLFVAGNVLHIDAIATNTLGAYRWFNLGPLGSFQPAELMKFALVIYTGAFLGQRYKQGKINDLQATVYPVVGLTAVLLAIVVVLQKDMGTGVAIASTVMSMLVVSTMNWKTLGKIIAVGMMAGVLLIASAPHRMERISTFFSSGTEVSSATEDDNNYHIKNAMIALGTGGVLGRGIGKSIQATGYLPEAVNDSIFAIMGEIFGFVGTVLIVALFGLLLFRILHTVDRLPDMSMRLAAAGVFGWLLAHVVMNIASMIGLIPLTGITLPLLSFGGTSMVFMSGALGLVFQLSHYTAHKPIDIKEEANANTGSRRRVGGSRYSSRRRIA